MIGPDGDGFAGRNNDTGSIRDRVFKHNKDGDANNEKHNYHSYKPYTSVKIETEFFAFFSHFSA
jgi:hypothetical protein